MEQLHVFADTVLAEIYTNEMLLNHDENEIKKNIMGKLQESARSDDKEQPVQMDYQRFKEESYFLHQQFTRIREEADLAFISSKAEEISKMIDIKRGEKQLEREEPIRKEPVKESLEL